MNPQSNRGRIDRQLNNIDSLESFEELFAEMGFDSADAPVVWSDGKPDGVVESRVLATAGEDLFGEGFVVIYLKLADATLRLERQAIEALRKTYASALYLTTFEGQQPLWRLVDIKPGTAAGSKKAVYRRMTLDPEEGTCRTIREQLSAIVVDPNDSVIRVAEKVHEAFNVEAVTKRFFSAFIEVFLSFKNAIAQTPGVNADEARLEAQTLLDRLIFLYFIQKRGWLDGDKQYLYNNFQKYAVAPAEGGYYGEFLVGLFVALSHAQTNSEYPQRVPFLNGGLFDLDPFSRTSVTYKLQLPNGLFADAFEKLFNRYNFTVREDTPIDQEVAIDPEMLGKVFESLILEGEKAGSDDDLRHATGSYYTPREIVHFMARRAISTYLSTQLETQLKLPPERAREKAHVLLAPGEFEYATPEDHERIRQTLSTGEAELLRGVVESLRVLDPAVGSGAFLIGALHELVNIRKLLHYRLDRAKTDDPNYTYDLKIHTIGHNLYGVDIQKQAVRITELRLWLSLAVDYTPERKDGQDDIRSIPPLPNLSYQVREGDTLSDRIFETYINPGDYRQSQQIKPAVDSYRTLKTSYYRASEGTEKASIELSLIELRLTLAQALVQQEAKSTATEDALFGSGRKTKAQKALEERNQAATATLKRLETLQKRAKEARELSRGTLEGMAKFNAILAQLRDELGGSFVWDVDFADVKATGGFDIVLANPPYLRQEAIDKLLGEGAKRRLQALYPRVGTGMADLYVYFYKRGAELLKPDGVLSFISSNKFMRADYGAKLRAFLSGETDDKGTAELSLEALIDFGDLPVFDATTYPMIVVASKRSPVEATAPLILRVFNLEVLADFEDYFATEAQRLPQRYLLNSGWILEREEIVELFIRLLASGVPLGKFIGDCFRYGIKTGYNEAFVIDKEQCTQLLKADPNAEELIFPFLTGKDVKRWHVRDTKHYLIALQSSSDESSTHPWANAESEGEAEAIFQSSYPAVYAHMKGHESRLRARTDQGRYWWELRPCAYYEEFKEPKIVYPDISKYLSFAYDESGYFGGNTLYFIPAKEKWLLGLLNSSLTAFIFSRLTSTIQGNFMRFFSDYMYQLPIVEPSEEQKGKLEALVEKILDIQEDKPLSGKAIHVPDCEREINGILYDIYGLTPDERELIEWETTSDFFGYHLFGTMTAEEKREFEDGVYNRKSQRSKHKELR